MSRNFADRLIDAILRCRTPAVVNVDPAPDHLPPGLPVAGSPLEGGGTDARRTLERIRAFCGGVLRVVAPLVPAVKINIACFEPFRAPGVQAYHDLVAEAAKLGLLVIGDVKRGDVGHTAEMYARAHLGGTAPGLTAPDAVTVNGYFGEDGVRPFLAIARAQDRGVFVLVRTSNESAASIQDLVTAGGPKVHDVIAGLVDRWARESGPPGEHGYSAVGAVVATRNAEDAGRLRAALPRSILLVPGYGAQGGTAEAVAPYFKADGTGAIVAAGRSVIHAHEEPRYRRQFGDDWRRCVEAACRAFIADLAQVVKTRGL